MRYKVKQHNASGGLEDVIIDTDQDITRLLAHAHIHSAELITEPDPYIRPQVETKQVKRKK